jgi:hypothetical protein
VNNVLDSQKNIFLPNELEMVVGSTEEIKYDINCIGIKLQIYNGSFILDTVKLWTMIYSLRQL